MSGSVCVGCCFCGAQNFAVCHFSTRFACKRNLHLNSILNSYAACNTHRAMRRGRGPEGVTLSACERQSMHACCAVHLCVCACVYVWHPLRCFLHVYATLSFHCFGILQVFYNGFPLQAIFCLSASSLCLLCILRMYMCVRVLVINCYRRACTFMFHSCT